MGHVSYTGAVSVGMTACEGTEWVSDSSVRSLVGQVISGTRRVSVTVGERTGSTTETVSVDAAAMSVVRRANGAGT
eukprot:3414277-Rhodomonas_salina.1